MAASYAICTLLTNDAYLPGAIALVAALRDLHPKPAQAPEVDFQAVCLVTPETVDVSSIKLLRRTFDLVVGVEIIDQTDDKNLQLLGEHTFSFSPATASSPRRGLVRTVLIARHYLYSTACFRSFFLNVTPLYRSPNAWFCQVLTKLF
jgi:hypothetical protein